MSENITNNPSVPTQVVAEVKFPRFINNLGIIPTSYKDSMSYYETLAWLCKYLEETVLPTVNQNGEATQELQALYIQLNNYVAHYFDNLDVQEEINNKLDEMVEDGTLQEIIASYLNANALWCFDNVEDMKNSTNLIDGSIAKTLGYYNINDGGKGLYRIRNITTNDNIDEGSIIAINVNLVAELIANNINVEQFGAKGNGIDDDSQKFQNALNYASTNKCKINLMKDKVYLISNTLRIYQDTEINLNESTIKVSRRISLFLNFNPTDEYLLYNGNGNIKIYNGIIDGGVISFIHGKNIKFIDIIFKSCLWDHFIEICACKDFIIKNCEFNGIIEQESERQYVEAIQIDVCKYIAFPYFNDENNPTYDDTLNKNIYIENCKFTQGDTGFSLYTAIGSHSWSANTSNYNDNIQITKCIIDSPENDAIRLYSCSNSSVKNCLIKNVGKKGIIVDGTSSNVFIENNVITNCGETNIGIYNNENLYTKENIYIKNNVINSPNSTTIAIKDVTKMIIENNNFSVDSVDTQYFYLNNSLNTIFKNNAFNKNILNNSLFFVGATTTFDYCDFYLRLFYGNATNSITMALDITLFNDLLICMGAPGSGTYTSKNIHSWVLENFRLNDKFQFNNGETKQSFAIDSTNPKVIVSSVASGTQLPIRGIYGRKI